MIEPAFEELARTKTAAGGGGVAFVKVDLGVGMGVMVAREFNVAATPTFGFFLDGKRVRWLVSAYSPPFFLGGAKLRLRTDS